MPNRYYEKDGSLDNLNGRTVAIIGYGSQGHAHALNLRDSGASVVVGLYPGSKSKDKAEAAGLRVLSVSDAARAADMIMILVSDHIQADLYNKEIAPHLKAGKTVMFAHGFNIHFGFIAPLPMWTFPWSPRRRPDIACANSSPKALAFPPLSPSTRIHPERPFKTLSPTLSLLAASRRV